MRPHQPPQTFNIGGKTLEGRIDHTRKCIDLEGLEEYSQSVVYANVKTPPTAQLICTLQLDPEYEGYWQFRWGYNSRVDLHTVPTTDHTTVHNTVHTYSPLPLKVLQTIVWINNLDSILESDSIGMPYYICAAVVNNISKAFGKPIHIIVRSGDGTIIGDSVELDDIEIDVTSTLEFYI